MALNLDWAPRDHNEEADALTNLDFSGFDPARRVEIVLESIPWIAMDSYMKVAEEMHRSIQEKKAESAGKQVERGSSGKGRKTQTQKQTA